GLLWRTRGQSGAVSSPWSLLLHATLRTTFDLQKPQLQQGVSPGYRRQQGDDLKSQMIRQRCHCKISILYVECTSVHADQMKTCLKHLTGQTETRSSEELEAFEKRQQRGGRRSKKRGRREEVDDDEGRAGWWRKCAAAVLVPLVGALLSATAYYLLTTP
ncbi:hypothetical protein E3U43_016798, partial [Larimichthys crocea]